jgi:outer membrane protein assembly factor BamB/tRNA A-37 threonylcarbamoyl transferase component Bud32
MTGATDRRRGDSPPRDGVHRRAVLATAGAIAGAVAAPPTLAQSTGRAEWPMYGGGPSNTGYLGSSAEIRQNPSRKWDLNIKTPAKSGFAVVDGTVYAYGDNGNVYAVSDAGDVQVYGIGAAGNGTANSKLPVERTATPAVAEGALYVGGLDGQVYAIDVDQQSQVWSTDIGQSIRASPVVTGGRAFVASTDGTVAALSVVDGAQEWSASTESQVLSSPAIDEGALYVGAGDARLYAFGIGNGTVEWGFDADGAVHASPTVGASHVYAGTLGGTLYAVRKDGGSRAWSYEATDDIVGSPVLAQESLFVVDRSGVVHAVEPSDGTERWTASTGESVVSDPAATERTIYVGTETGRLLAFDREDGAQQWSLGVGGSIVGALAVADGTVYAGTADGHAVAVQEDTGLVPTALGIVNDGIETVQRNRTLAIGVGGSGVGLVGGYVAIKKVLGRSPESPIEEPADAGPDDTGESTEVRSTGAPSPGDSLPIADPSVASRDLPDLSNATYDEFEEGELIGSGGSADVNEATIVRDGVEYTVALKTPRMSDYETVDADFFEEFVEEAEVWNELDDHDNIVSVLGWGSEPFPWIALEYMDAGNLDDLVDDLSFDEAFAHLEGLCEGVHHAHRHGVTHTDLKPENVLYSSADEAAVPRITDWGLANVLIDHSTSVQGLTPAYAAPEQIDPDTYGGTDDRTDVYQLGVIAYELLTGELPFDRGNYTATMNAVLNEEPTPPHELNERVTPAASDAVTRALARDKERRYETVLHFRDALREAYRSIDP